MDLAKVSAVIKWPTPKNVCGLSGFLGLTGYYRRFIYDYSKLVAPLTALLTKEATKPWNWTETATSTFEALKLVCPLLRLPDFSKEFVVECDTIGRGIGAVLMQDKQPIAYFSKGLSTNL